MIDDLMHKCLYTNHRPELSSFLRMTSHHVKPPTIILNFSQTFTMATRKTFIPTHSTNTQPSTFLSSEAQDTVSFKKCLPKYVEET